MTTSSNQRLDVYASITHQIIKAIELGTGDVKMPWHRCGGSIERPVNVESKRTAM
jgi:antirestriction protein ArdC